MAGDSQVHETRHTSADAEAEGQESSWEVGRQPADRRSGIERRREPRGVCDRRSGFDRRGHPFYQRRAMLAEVDEQQETA